MLGLGRRRPGRGASCTSPPPTWRAAHAGVFREDMLDAGQGFRNTYEQTKWEAEHLVADAPATSTAWPSRGRASSWGSPTRAGRPPSTSSTGRCARSPAGCSTRCPAEPDGRVDVVPVDYVADGIVAPDRGRRRRRRSTSSPARTPPRSTSSPSSRAPTSTARGRRTCRPGRSATRGRRARRGLPALLRHVRRVRRHAHARRALGLRPPLLRDYFDALMDYADLARWGKRGSTREEARERVAAAAG